MRIHLFAHHEMSGEHGRGEIVYTDLVAKIETDTGMFIGNWTVRRYHGDGTESAKREVERIIRLFVESGEPLEDVNDEGS